MKTNSKFIFRSRAIQAAGLLAVSTAVFSVRASDKAGDANLSNALRGLDTSVFQPAERATAARMLANQVQRRLRQSNARSSAEWKRISSREEWEGFRKEKLSLLRNSLGESTIPASLHSKITGTLSGDGYRIENVIYESRPGLWVTANLYRPDPLRASMPGILISHAHHTPKEQGELQDMGVTWARAGSIVLVPDHLGHGERRQHPFNSAADYSRPFQVSRQDYYFRYDLGIQLHLVGESLIGWIAWDLMRGVDLLLTRENIDPKRIILLGAVAGGGDPASVAAALDDRIAAAVPFNFGGPQPETHYPLPSDAETWFNYAGGGSWESTRNLRRSASDGFLPWVIVGSIAPRRLVYGHEFSWDQERDPIWKRLQAIYKFYDEPDHLAFTHGRGELRGQPQEASHCTHIGPVQRQLIHAAFKRWFGIDVVAESSDRHPPESLRAMTPAATRELRPKKLNEIFDSLAGERIGRERQRLENLLPDQRRRELQKNWVRILGPIQPELEIDSRQIGVAAFLEFAATPQKINAPSVSVVKSKSTDSKSTISLPQRQIKFERFLLTSETGIELPLVLVTPETLNAFTAKKPAVVVAFAQGGKQKFLRERASDVAALLENGLAVCLPDLRGTGETSPGKDRGRRSEATAISSSELMLGGTMLGAQVRDLRTVLKWLRGRDTLDAQSPRLWADSFVPPNPSNISFQIPRDDDALLPSWPEPMGELVALLGALFDQQIQAVYVHGGVVGFQSVLANYLALIPHDAVVPGALTTGDLCDLIGSLAPRRIRVEGLVDGWNRLLSDTDDSAALKPAFANYKIANATTQFSCASQRTYPASWLVTPFQKN